ncbi:site-2 protease family protein [Solimonas sp. K1W22B-7]|uniref:site-2 protease family protein n=1 Tax=Solimonas sp. K1W22B-7 TaxID=2303331 RepID=UPI000E337801|nr:site-2 protease family protein [Solimonas sp. K1W22B-7]AXQ29229.1 site-2 protease family protein [Solimonas sp. K1W22B-7]
MPVDSSLVQTIAIWALPVLFAITLHEVAHGLAARRLGDPTAASQGRLSLNPLRHVDPVGTVVVPIVLLVLSKLAGGGFLFGWAKPVPVDYRRLRHPHRDMALVAAAGPLANLLMAIGWGLLLKLALTMGSDEGLWLGLRYMSVAGVTVNLVLMVLNLIPLPPLDGGRVLTGLLPLPLAVRYAKLEPYGLLIVVGLLATGLLSKIMYWPLFISESLLYTLLGLNPSLLY